MLHGLAVGFGVVFVAELGDKSQLLAMTLAARYRPLPVLAGIAVATLVLQGLAVTVGTLIGDRLPTRPIQFVAGPGVPRVRDLDDPGRRRGARRRGTREPCRR